MTEAIAVFGATMLLVLTAAAVLVVLRARTPDAPFSIDHSVHLVQQFLADGRLMEAMVVSKKLAGEYPQNLRLRLLRVDVIRARDGEEQALRELEALQRQWPRSGEVAAQIREWRRS